MRTVSAALVLVAALAWGCSGNGDDPTTATSSTSPPVSAATAAGLPPPIDYGPATLVTGTDTFSVDEGKVTKDPDGTVHIRGSFTSKLTCEDERVAGAGKATWNATSWDDGGALVQWGRARIVNAEGAWVGRYTGVFTAKTFDNLTWWYTGRGAYEGLSMYMWEETSGGTEATFQALIFPGAPPQ